MEEKKVKLINKKKLLFSVTILVCSIVIIGFSLTYAYFEVSYTGSENVTGNKAATLNVTSTLQNADAINESEMVLIESSQVEDKARKVTFNVKNENNSNVKAKYTVKLVNYSITKNLSSEYVKWKLVVTHGSGSPSTFQGNFLQSNVPEGTRLQNNGQGEDVITSLNKELIPENQALELAAGASDTLTFYVWLENDSTKDQLYLTNGKFSGKLSVEAYPSKP